jgi:hypothetical protein
LEPGDVKNQSPVGEVIYIFYFSSRGGNRIVFTSTVSSKGGNIYVLLFQYPVGEVIYIVFTSTGSSRGGNRYFLLLNIYYLPYWRSKKYITSLSLFDLFYTSLSEHVFTVLNFYTPVSLNIFSQKISSFQ